MWNPIAFHAKMIDNIIYFHQALKQTDASSFLQAVVKRTMDMRTIKPGNYVPKTCGNCVISLGNVLCTHFPTMKSQSTRPDETSMRTSKHLMSITLKHVHQG